MSDRKEQVRAALERAGLLPTKEDLDADQSVRDLISFVLGNIEQAPTSSLIMCMNPALIVRAVPQDVAVDHAGEWVSQTMGAVSAEIDRRIPVPT